LSYGAFKEIQFKAEGESKVQKQNAPREILGRFAFEDWDFDENYLSSVSYGCI
jgi:hypothetical protein